jgi:general stress protein YciG
LNLWRAIGPVTFNPRTRRGKSIHSTRFLKETIQMASSNQGNQGGGQAGQGAKPGNASGKPSGKSERGFAAMDPERQREIASEGGKAAHESGHAHEFTSEEAREAGRKGGQASGGGQGANKGGTQGRQG